MCFTPSFQANPFILEMHVFLTYMQKHSPYGDCGLSLCCHEVKLGGNWHKETNEKKATRYTNKSILTSKIISRHSEILMYVDRCF